MPVVTIQNRGGAKIQYDDDKQPKLILNLEDLQNAVT